MGKAFNRKDYSAIVDWILDGFTSVKTELTFRHQPKYPNTLCRFWVRPQIHRFLGKTGEGAWACQDIHYRPDGSFMALGGFWINGVRGYDVKPEQEMRGGGRYSADAYDALKGSFPAAFPDAAGVAGLMTYDRYVGILSGPAHGLSGAHAGAMAAIRARA
ncbi:MAG: hypothetical protein AAF744_04580 [Pseudomonadota bacterium]